MVTTGNATQKGGTCTGLGASIEARPSRTAPAFLVLPLLPKPCRLFNALVVTCLDSYILNADLIGCIRGNLNVPATGCSLYGSAI